MFVISLPITCKFEYFTMLLFLLVIIFLLMDNNVTAGRKHDLKEAKG